MFVKDMIFPTLHTSGYVSSAPYLCVHMYCCSTLLLRKCLSWHGYLLLCSKIGSSHSSDLAVVNVPLAQCCPLMHLIIMK